jgi:hypothetical protein
MAGGQGSIVRTLSVFYAASGRDHMAVRPKSFIQLCLSECVS